MRTPDDILRRAGLASAQCLACDVCCRFASPAASFIPFFTATEAADCGLRIADRGLGGSETGGPQPGTRPLVEPDGDHWRCPFRAIRSQECTIYDRRPLDCRLYPFVLMFDEAGKGVWLGLDEVCPFALDAGRARLQPSRARGENGSAGASPSQWQQAVEEVASLLDGPLADTIAAAPGIVSRFQDHIRPLRVLPEVTRRLCRCDLGLARLVATSYPSLRDFFHSRRTCLSGHAFPAICLWADLFNLHWKVEGDCLLVFAESDGVSFLIAPPFGKGDLPKALAAARETMAAINGPRGGARAQEVDAELLPAFAAAGWQVGHRAQEYICETASLVELRGRHFDGRRHDIRRFEKLHKADWRPYRSADLPQCVALLRRWQEERATAHPDPFYRDQIEATGFLHLRTLREAEELGLQGYVAEIEGTLPGIHVPLPPGEGRVRGAEAGATPISTPLTLPSPKGRGPVAYTFGVPLADEATFADFLEVADLGYPGLAAWTFRQFCREARDYPFLNVGTDSELPSLARAKLAYRPARVVPAYILNAPQ